MLLQIAIPTYDRPASLEVTLRDLIPQIVERPARILILDNHSPGDLEAEMRGRLSDLDLTCIYFHRNIVNIGLYANILRCFELSEDPYLWIVSDDDRIRPDAVANILDCIQQGEFDYLMANDSRRPGLINGGDGHGLEGLVRYFSGTASFLPTSVYRRDHFIPFLRIGYQYLSSGIPHLALVMAAAAKGLRWKTIDIVIVDFVPTRDGSYQRSVFYDGFPMLNHLAFERSVRRELSQGIWDDLMGWLGPWGIVRSLAHGEFTYSFVSLRMPFRMAAILIAVSDGKIRWSWWRWIVPFVASFWPGGIRRYSTTNESVNRN